MRHIATPKSTARQQGYPCVARGYLGGVLPSLGVGVLVSRSRLTGVPPGYPRAHYLQKVREPCHIEMLHKNSLPVRSMKLISIFFFNSSHLHLTQLQCVIVVICEEVASIFPEIFCSDTLTFKVFFFSILLRILLFDERVN